MLYGATFEDTYISLSVDFSENGESLLNGEKMCFPLNSSLCCNKDSMFCSTEFTKMFSGQYKQLDLVDIFGESRSPTCLHWFSSDGWQTEKVYVSTAFGFLLGILQCSKYTKRRYFGLKSILLTLIDFFGVQRRHSQLVRTFHASSS